MDSFALDDETYREFSNDVDAKRDLEQKKREYCDRVCKRIKMFEDRIYECSNSDDPDCKFKIIIATVFLNYWRHEQNSNDCQCSQ